MRAITVRQPWAYLISRGHKPVENRAWQTSYRGPLIIHAAAKPDDIDINWVIEEYQVPIDRAQLHRGVTVAVAELHDVVTDHPSPFFSGPFGWVLRNVQRVPAIPMKGKLSLYEPPSDVRLAITNYLNGE